jgi:hypothetical protein
LDDAFRLAAVSRGAASAGAGSAARRYVMSPRLGRILTEGLFTGVIGYAVVAIGIGLLDVLGGRAPFHTVGLLGSVVFFGVRDVADAALWPGPVLAFNGLHLLVFLLLGTLMAWLGSLAERGPQLWYVSLIALLFVLLHLFALPIWFDPAIRPAVSAWTIAIATSTAVVAMFAYLWRSHPRLRERVAQDEA